MIALSIRQPWAWLIANGHKDIENRDWPTGFRGRILIHAGKTMSRKYYDGVLAELVMGTKVPSEIINLIPAYEVLERGGIVGVSTITDCVSTSASCWFFGPHGFVMQDSKPLPFFPVNGQLKLFDVRGVPL